MFDFFFLWAANVYRNDLYLTGSQLAGLLCSYADIAIVWIFLKITDAIRGGPPSAWSYRILLIFFVLTPVLLLVENSTYFFILQFAVLGPPYLVLARTVIKEAPRVLRHLHEKIHPTT